MTKKVNSDIPTAKEVAFVAAYCAVGSDTCGILYRSAIKAGFNEKTASREANRLMQKPYIRQMINDTHQKIADKYMVNTARVLTELENIKERALLKGDLAAANIAVANIGKTLSMFGEKIIFGETETPTQLTDEEAEELQEHAKKLTQIRLRKGTA